MTQRGAGATAAPGATLPLVLLPGTLCDARVFAAMLSHLPAEPALTLPLAPGASTADVAERLLAQAPPRFALLGFSLGGIVAMEMASRAPERIAGLALLAANVHPAPPATHGPRRAAALEAQASGLERHVRNTLWPLYAAPGAPASADLQQAVLDMAAAFDARDYARQTEVALSRTDRREALGALEAPVLVLGGDEDRLCPPAALRALAHALPRARLVLLPGAGHFALLEQPEAVAAHVGAWLSEVRPCAT